MSIALCLYGHFRCFDQCWPQLYNNLLIPNNISDIFAVSWADSMGLYKEPVATSNPITHMGYNENSPGVQPNYLAQVMQFVQPKSVHLDNYFLHDERFSSMLDTLNDFHHPDKNHRPKGTLSQVYGRCTSLALAQKYEEQHSFTYDRIICTRWDIDYNKVIDLNNLDPNVISMDGMYGHDVISDAWACGPSVAMRLWGRQFSDIDLLVKLSTMNLGPHEWLMSHFTAHKIPWTNCPDLGIYIRR